MAKWGSCVHPLSGEPLGPLGLLSFPCALPQWCVQGFCYIKDRSLLEVIVTLRKKGEVAAGESD